MEGIPMNDPRGVDLFGNAPTINNGGPLARTFAYPPFSVLNTREGWWQERKRQWVALGIQSELGRDARCFGQDMMRGEYTVGERDALPAGLCFGEIKNFDGAGRTITGTSIFDPVLTELAMRWFCPAGGTVLDPFAGGSVRGVVTATLGRNYVGMDLSEKQIEANRTQAAEIGCDPMPDWRVGDSATIATACTDVVADFIFSCPPYGDLEVYSDDPRDLSTMSPADFKNTYAAIIDATCSLLRNDRFACFVVSDFRDDAGMYHAFPSTTIAAFRRAGLKYYNEAILLNSIGSLPVRVQRQFDVSRKLGRCHQNVLIFCKGDPKVATALCEKAPGA